MNSQPGQSYREKVVNQNSKSVNPVRKITQKVSTFFRDGHCALKTMAEQKKVAVPVSKKNKYIFLSVPNFKKSVEEVNGAVDKWLYLLNHAKDGKELPNFGSEIMKDAIERIKVANAPDELLAAQEKYMTTKEDYESWAAGLVIHAREEARAEGHAKGKAEGRAEERDKRNTEMALDMLADNKPIEEIVKYSHLPMEKVLELRDSQAMFTAK